MRLQLQKKTTTADEMAAPKYRGMLGTVITILREEGLTALWKGLVPGLQRQCLFGGLRIGLYEPVSSNSCSYLEHGSICHAVRFPTITFTCFGRLKASLSGVVLLEIFLCL